MPRIPGIRGLYRAYFTQVLPRVGGLVSKHGEAYSYLPASVESFPRPDQFVTMLRQIGFSSVRAVRFSFGIVYFYTAVR
jgi:demethylmenaquinone methyltransferase/2-methoxy-6-polyprenyl-1,4-benzoquinol methylase